MEKEGIDYILGIANSMVFDENIVRVIKQNFSVKIEKESFEEKFVNDNCAFYYCEFSDRYMIKAYEPFLDIIRDMIEKLNINISEMMEKLGVYSLNKSIFQSYLEEGIAERKEMPLVPERDYDNMRFRRDLTNILLYLADKKQIFLLINRANLMCDSTLSILEELLEKNNYHLKILILTNEMGSVKDYIVERYAKFIENCERKSIVEDWPFEGFSEGGDTEFTFSMNDQENEIRELRNMFFTYAIDQANYYLKMIYKKVELDKVEVSVEYRLNMFCVYMLVCIFRDNYPYALILCERLARIDMGEKNDYREYICWYFRSMANMYGGNEDDAIRSADLCLKKARELNDSYVIFMAKIIRNMSQLSGWKEIWICDKKIDIDDGLIDEAYEQGYLNHLAHIFVYCFDNDPELFDRIDEIELRTPSVTKGIWIAKKLGNEQFLVEAYRKNVMVASCNGFFNVANYFYTKSIEVVRKNNDRFEEANIYNGLGYNCCTSDKFSEANRYYNKALAIFVEKKSSDYIVETLYNLGTNAILAGDYQRATEYLTTVINILTKLKKNSIRVCNISKIFGLNALALYKQENYYSAQVYCRKSENYLRYIIEYCEEESYSYLWDDDMFLFFFVSALLDAKKKNYDKAFEHLDKAEIYMHRCVGSKFFNYVHFSVEKAMILKELGRKEEARKVLTQAKEYFAEKGNFFRVKALDDMIQSGYSSLPHMKMNLTDVTFDEINEVIKWEDMENDAKNRRQQIKFFGTFQELINNSYEDVNTQINTLVTNFKNNFKLDNFVMVMCDGDRPEVRYSDLEYEISEQELGVLEDYFINNTSGFAISKFSNNYYDYERIWNILDKSKVFSVVGVPIYRHEELYSFFITFVRIPESWNAVIGRETLDSEDMDVFTIVFRQMIDAVEKFKLNERLINQARTDELTGLYNRKGFYEFQEDILRDAAKANRVLQCSFVYIDLDHFKYYNDTFGHNVGDAILKKFAEIFTKACPEEKGTVVRFGGDEFVILLGFTDREKIEKITGDIYEQVEKEDGFENLISKYIGSKVSIPKETRATCSIGIDRNDEVRSESQISTMRKHADEALYYMKKNGRGGIMFYEDMEVAVV